MKLRNWLLALPLVALGFVACDKDDDDDNNTPPPPPAATDIVSIASGTPDLSSLVAAVSRFPDLVTLLSSDGTYTVFAPTNQAFSDALAALGFESLEDVPDEILREILEYHVILGAEVASGDLSNGTTAIMVNAQPIVVLTDGGVSINGSSNVATADVDASNGIVHIIDAVLVPNLEGPVAVVKLTNQGFSAYRITEIVGSGATGVSGIDNPLITLNEGGRYYFYNAPGTGHPLALRNGDTVLLDEAGGGTLSDDATAAVVSTNRLIGFNVAGDIATQLDNYVCTLHSSMSGDININ